MFKIGDNIKCFFKFIPPQKAIQLSAIVYEVNNEEDKRPTTYSVQYNEDRQIDRNRPACIVRYQIDTNNTLPSRLLVPDCATLEDSDEDTLIEDDSSTKSIPSNKDDSLVLSTESPIESSTEHAKVTSLSLGNSEGDTDVELTDTHTTESATLSKSGLPIPTIYKKSLTNKVICLKDMASLEAAYSTVPPEKKASSYYRFM